MKAEKIYNLLKEKSDNFKVGVNILQLLELKVFLESEIKLENVKDTTTKQRVNACLRYVKKVEKSQRPILAYSCNDLIDGMQIYTDGYFAVGLSEEDKLPIDDYKASKKYYDYPDIRKVLNDNRYNDNNKIFVNIKDILTALKTKEGFYFKTKDFTINIAGDNFKRFIDFMNIKASEMVELYYINSYTPVKVYHNNSYGVLLPIRYGDGVNYAEIN